MAVDSDDGSIFELLPRGQREIQRSPKNIGGGFPWRSVSWRFVCSALFSILIMVVIHSYAERDSLGPWDRRIFTTLTLLLSALVSLSLGSLLGLLGAVIRWPLLAKHSHTPRDVDLVLGMPNPTGSLKLVMHHCGWSKKWSTTTTIVLVYLVVNIIGRLSVAIFDLTYDLNDNAGIEYPVMYTDFGGPEWMRAEPPSENQDLGQINNFALAGLTVVDTKHNRSDPSTYNMKNISGKSLDRSITGDRVTYTYHLREYRGLDEYASTDRILHSSSQCLGRSIFNKTVYEKGKPVADLNDELASTAPEWLRILAALQAYFDPAIHYIWAKNWNYEALNDATACVTSYLHNEVYPGPNATFFSCTTCLTSSPSESNGRGLDANPFFHFSPFGAYDRISAYSYDVGAFASKEYSSEDHTMHFVNELGAMRYSQLGEGWYATPVLQEYELHAAHLTARLPILAVMGAEARLPRVVRDAGASEQPYIVTSLEVKWGRGMGVLGAILAGQLIAVAVVWAYSRGVWVRDHESFFSIATVLRTAVVQGRGRSSDTGEQLAERMRGVVGEGGMRYGTRDVGVQGRRAYELDVWRDVKGVFPRHGGVGYV
ncbi:hypothetical protein QBC34DRAFT_460104 [Podospora aff. communis PSN243]|uniref:Uncharacterized protein n=1 Tax=Podospora aff. communis PSN243 TaxID=3040156 RepID=A0AAV9H3T7_9PEZI|nr:hypothetical protein QBC34DRAFT_460104 [Podospora aff. communis PSN243]